MEDNGSWALNNEGGAAILARMNDTADGTISKAIPARPSPAPPEPVGLPVKVEVLQRADRLVFPVVCLLLTLVRRLLPGPDKATAPKPRSVIFVKLAEQGSTVLAGRAFRRAVEWV